MVHVHILGASGSGTTTLGRALAGRLAVPHLDTDDIYWLQTDPPYTTPRNIHDRRALLLEQTPPDSSWILSGSVLKWGQSAERLYNLIVFLQIDPAIRMQRIREREVARHGARILPGGDMAVKSAEFLEWAANYDTAGPEHRSLAAHEQWLQTQQAAIMRLDSSRMVEELVAEICGHPVLMSER